MKKLEPLYTSWGYKTVQPLWKTVWHFFTWLSTEFPYHTEIPHLGGNENICTHKHVHRCSWQHYLGGNENICAHKNLYTNVLGSIIYDSQKRKQPNFLSADEWINKMWYFPVMDYYLAIK